MGSNGREGRKKGCEWEVMAGRGERKAVSGKKWLGGEEERLWVGRSGWEGGRKGCGWEVMAGMGGEEERLEEEANNCSPPVRFPIRPVQCTIHTMSIFIPHLYTVQRTTVQRTIYTVAYAG